MSDLKSYMPSPFWFLNHKLEKEEICRQLDLMKEQHINSFFMHPRSGLLTSYGSTEWFDMVRFIVDEAEKRGMGAWLYDEDPYPSGPAGGRIFMNKPELAARELKLHVLTPDENGVVNADLGTGRLLEALQVRTDDDGNVLESIDMFDEVGVLRKDFFCCLWKSSYYAQIFGRIIYPHYRAETFRPRLHLDCTVKKGWKIFAVAAETVLPDEKYGLLPDNLNPDTCKEFMRLTHKKYEKTLAGKLGTAVKGLFTDETSVGGVTPWTGCFEKEFQARRNYPISGLYHKIFTGVGEDACQLRHDYWKTVQELFLENFFTPVNDWCNKHNIKLTGHGIGEEDPLAATNGMNIYALQDYVGIPGFDHITHNIPNGKDFYSLNSGGKLVASAASQNGVTLVQSESLGCNPYNFGQDGMKKVAHWLYSIGITWLVPHGFHYSYDGFRKDDAGKSYFYQDPEYPQFHRFADYFGRLGFKLGEAKTKTNLCMLYPISAFRRLMPACPEKALALREVYYRTMQNMFDRHLQFELADDYILADCPIENGFFQVKSSRYNTLVLPIGELSPDSLAVVERLRKAGIRIVGHEELDLLIGIDGFQLQARTPGAESRLVMPLLKQTKQGGNVLYLFNNQDIPSLFSFKVEAETVYRYNAENDTHQQLWRDPATGEFVFALGNYDACILEYGCEIAAAAAVCPELPAKHQFIYESKPEWDYLPPMDGIIRSIRDWNFRFGSQDMGVVRYTLVRDLVGTSLDYLAKRSTRPIFDLAKKLPVPYPQKAVFSTEFELNQDQLDVVLLAEYSTMLGDGFFVLNGQRIERADFTRVRRYDPWNIQYDISKLVKPGKNTLEVCFPAAEEFCGLCSMVYIAEK